MCSSDLERLATTGDRDTAIKLMLEKMVPLQKVYFGQLDDLSNMQQKLMDQSVEDAEATYTTTRNIMLVAGIVALGAGAIALIVAVALLRSALG